jgi:hypothetical protein
MPLRKWRCAIQLRSSSTAKDYEPPWPDGLGHPVLADILYPGIKASCDKNALMDVVVTMRDFVFLASDLEADAVMLEKILPRS